MRHLFFSPITFAVLVLGYSAYSLCSPLQNVSAKLHPNLAAAQKSAVEAYDKIVAAQKANEWDLAGHAQKAKDLLERVNAELKLAAESANQNSK